MLLYKFLIIGVWCIKMSLISIIKGIGTLKNIPRTGWLVCGVPASLSESVAEHIFESTLYAAIIGERLLQEGIKLDPRRVMLITLVHDLPEAYIGDIVKKVKRDREIDKVELDIAKSMIEIGTIGNAIIEYLESKSLEAKISKLSELLATYTQARRYYNMGFKDVKEIIESTTHEIRTIIKDPLLKKISIFIEEILELDTSK